MLWYIQINHECFEIVDDIFRWLLIVIKQNILYLDIYFLFYKDFFLLKKTILDM